MTAVPEIRDMTGASLSARDFGPAGAPCQVCGGREAAPYFTHTGMTLVRCADCGFVYMDPLPGPRLIARMYGDTYHGATTSYFTKSAKKIRRSWRRLAVLAALCGFRTRGRRFLDIGASGGFAVEAARRWGFEAYGIELDPASVAYARAHFPGCRFLEGTIEDAVASGAVARTSIDAAYCSEVIEHLPDVNPFVAAIAAALRPGGLLYLTTPDIGHWRRPRDLRDWDGFAPPAHCLYFDPATLRRLLAKHGLKTVFRFPALKPGIKLVARRS